MSITAAQVKELREKSGAGMMDCKKALNETNGDMDSAVDWLRTKGLAAAAKKSGRVASEGLVAASVSDGVGALIELNSETDFAAKDTNFLSFVDKVSTYISENKVTNVDSLKDSELEEARKSLVQTIGENIQIRRVITSDFDNEMNVGLYLHSDSKLASAVVINGGNNGVAKDIAMHVAAFNPLCLSKDDLDQEILNRERAIYENQAKDSGKPKEIMDKMVDGKVNRFLSEVSLLSQSFVKDPDMTVEEYLSNENASVISFTRLKVGEDIVIESKDFAEEVAEQLK